LKQSLLPQKELEEVI